MIRHIILCVALLIAGCATRPSVIRISDAPETDKPFDGVPMRLKTEQRVQLWRLDPDTGNYELVMERRQVLADQQRLYAINVVSWPFASPTLHITQFADNTPKLVQAAGSENASGALDAATNVVTGVATARNGNYTACQTARAAGTTQDQAAASAKAALDALPATATPELRQAYQTIYEKAQEAAKFARDNPQC